MNETQQYFLHAVSCALKTSAIEAPTASIDRKKLLQLAQEQTLTAVLYGTEPVAHLGLARCGAADPTYQDLP